MCSHRMYVFHSDFSGKLLITWEGWYENKYIPMHMNDVQMMIETGRNGELKKMLAVRSPDRNYKSWTVSNKERTLLLKYMGTLVNWLKSVNNQTCSNRLKLYYHLLLNTLQ